MKRIFNTLSILFLFSICFAQITAQNRKVTEQEITSLKNNAYEKLKNRTYRRTMTSESYKNINDKAPYYYVTSILENLPPDKSHYVYENKTIDGTKRTETITIGQKKYQRLNNESWNETASESSGFGGGSGTLVDTQKTVEYKYLGKKTIRDQDADLYEKKTTTKFESSGKKFTSIYTERFWFSKDGLFLKTENESKDGNDKITSHTIFEYEYNLTDLKIEAPIK